MSPAETLARFGNQVSRAFSNDLKLLSPAQLTDPEFRKMLNKKEGGRLIQEGDFIKQLDLASVLGRLRARGAGDFYTGLMGRQLVASVTKMGGSLSLEDLRAYKPIWRPTLKVPFIKNTTFHFPMLAGHSGVLAGQIIGMFIENDDWEDSSPPERAHLMAEIVSRAYAGRFRWLRKSGSSAIEPMKLVSESNIEKMIADFQPDRHTPTGNAGAPTVSHHGNSTGTSFVVVDRKGSAIACSLTLNNLFGVGRVVPGMGILLAGLPGPFGRGPDSTAATLLINNIHNIFYYGAAASGGTVAPSALAGVTTRKLLGKKEETLEMAISAKRLHHKGHPDVTYYEKGMNQTIVRELEKRGHRLSPVQSVGLVNAVMCPTGVPNKDEMSCTIRNDPRGFGLASGAE